ncbi:MAG: amidohydrolase [Pseudomonadales bacterium]
MNRKLLTILIFVTSLGVIALPNSAATEPFSASSPADIVLQNGRIYAGKNDNPWLSAVAITGDKFVYTGHDAAGFIGPQTKVHDLGGKTVIPGIIDGHSHPGFVALSGHTLLLDEASNKKQLMTAVKKLVAENQDRQVLIGGYWENELFDVTGPRKEALDAIEPNRPLILYDAWAHTVWANSAALKQAGVTRDTKDLVPGFSFYQKDKNGEPTGWITESAASVFINNFQKITPEVQASLLAYLEYYQGIGVTTVLDAGNFGLDREVFAAVSELDKKGLLPIRYHGAYTLFKPDDLDDAVETLKKLGEDFNSEKVRIDTLKIFFDGVLETRTAALSHDYYDTPGNSGDTLLSQEQVHELILELEAEGLNLHVHSVGDRAVTTILDAVQDTHNSLSRAPNIRITICHLEVVKDSDFPRFKKLGVIANFTPHWTIGGDLTRHEQGVGKSAFEMQRSQPLISDGAIVTFSSDITDAYEWKNDRANPYLGIQVGHNRQDVGVTEDGSYMPPMSERLQRKDLVNGYTTNAAYQLGREDEIGLIGVGKQADLIVLDQNIFEVDRYEIHKTKPLAVMVGGDVVSGSLR